MQIVHILPQSTQVTFSVFLYLARTHDLPLLLAPTYFSDIVS